MDIFKAVLIDVKTGDFKNLVFDSTRYDMGFGKDVPCSVQIMIAKEHEFMIPEYKKYIGNEFTIPVRLLLTKKKSIMRITGSDGLPLFA